MTPEQRISDIERRINTFAAQQEALAQRLTKAERPDFLDVLVLDAATPTLIGRYRKEAEHVVLLVNPDKGSFQTLLPSAKDCGRVIFIIRHIGTHDSITNTVTLVAKPGDKIDTAQTYVIYEDSPFEIFSDRVNTFLVGKGQSIFGTPPTNYTQFEADGTMVSYGDATTWDDVQFPIASGRVPAVNAPTFEAFTANTQEFSFAVNDYLYLTANEPPHGWKESSNLDFHLHLATKAANSTGSDRFVKFTIYIAYATINGVYAETSLTAEYTIPTGTAALTHLYLDFGEIAMTSMKIGSQVKCTIKRIAATGGTEYSGNIFITQVGAHFIRDTIGSRTETAK